MHGRARSRSLKKKKKCRFVFSGTVPARSFREEIEAIVRNTKCVSRTLPSSPVAMVMARTREKTPVLTSWLACIYAVTVIPGTIAASATAVDAVSGIGLETATRHTDCLSLGLTRSVQQGFALLMSKI